MYWGYREEPLSFAPHWRPPPQLTFAAEDSTNFRYRSRSLCMGSAPPAPGYRVSLAAERTMTGWANGPRTVDGLPSPQTAPIPPRWTRMYMMSQRARRLIARNPGIGTVDDINRDKTRAVL